MRFRRWFKCFIVTLALTLTVPAGLAQVIETTPQGSLHIDGKDDLVTTELRIDQSTAGAPVTMEAWVYPTATPPSRHHVITTDNSGYDWSILAEGKQWCVYTSRASKRTGFSVDLNRWQHVAAVFSDDGVVFYKNGSPSARFPIGYDSNTAPVNIGGNVKYRQHFTGRIDEVRVWSGALSGDDIRANMEQQVATGTAGLLGYWRFNAHGGDRIEDGSGNGNHGRLEGGARIESRR